MNRRAFLTMTALSLGLASAGIIGTASPVPKSPGEAKTFENVGVGELFWFARELHMKKDFAWAVVVENGSLRMFGWHALVNGRFNDPSAGA